MCERDNSEDTKVSEEGAGGGVSGVRAEIPLKHVEKSMMRQTVPLQHAEVCSGTDIHLKLREDPMLEQMDAQRSP